jgi:hypothetical protein
MASGAYLRGQMAGAIILALFGGGWLITSLAMWPFRPNWALSVAIVTAVTLVVLCVFRLINLKSVARSQDPAAAQEGRRKGMIFGLIFGAECGFIGLCSLVLARYGLGLWIPIVVALIVGLHFLPLAKLFNVPLYYWTGALCVLGVVACLMIYDPAFRLRCVGFTMTIVLWGTVLGLFFRVGRAERHLAAA